MTKLIRTKSGSFDLNTATNLEKLSSIKIIEEKLINPLDVLVYPKIELSDTECYKVITGQKIPAHNYNDGDIVCLIKDTKFIAIARVTESMIKVIKVFA